MTVVVWLSVVPVASGEDVLPPAWRGQPRSTVQAWDFLTEGETPVGSPETFEYLTPDAGNPTAYNSYGTPATGPRLAVTTGVTGLGNYQSPSGPGPGGAWWDFDHMNLEAPNAGIAAPGTWKDLRIQITYRDVLQTGMTPRLDILAGVPITAPTFHQSFTQGDWIVFVQDWHIEPNPVHESIEIENLLAGTPGAFAVSEVVVDTICVPEPASLGLLAVGGLALIRRRH